MTTKRYSRSEPEPVSCSERWSLPAAAWTAPTTAPAVAATALVTVSATDIALSPMFCAPSFTWSMTSEALRRTWAAFCRACPGAALAFLTRSPEVFFTDLAARPAAAVARLTAPVAFFIAPEDATFRRAPDADLLKDDFALAAIPRPAPPAFPFAEDRAAPRPAA